MKAILVLASVGILYGQTRAIVPEEVLQARQQAKAAASLPKPVYHPVTSDVTGALRPGSARQVGVTIWRLRPALASDTGARILIQEESTTSELVAERVASGTSLRQGDRVRLTIESPDTGFLYVIDRERYASGDRGEPYLIFPTSRTRGGDNRVTAGRLIDIPAQDDRPNFFSLRQSRPDQTEEELTVLLTSERLPDLAIGAKPLRLTNQQVTAWEKQWGNGKTELFELSGGVGKPWTQAEQQAAATTTRLLTQDDPPPQTIYRVAVKPGEPLMVKVSLRYSKMR